MKAMRIHSYGGPEVLRFEDAPEPKPNPGDVLVQVHAAGINPVDWKIRQGYRKEMLNHALPLILGWDFSGVVKSAGTDAVRFKPGDQVFCRPDIMRNGAYAEYIVVREKELALKPRSLDHVYSAAVPLACLTAWQSLFDAAHLSTRQKVLIHAAAGGVGHFAVQLAKWKGAYVVSTASSNNLEFVTKLGADEVIDYQAMPFENRAVNMDVVFDTIGGEVQDRSWKALKRGGTLVSIIRPPATETAAAFGVTGAYVFVQPNSEQLREIADLIDMGKIKPEVQTILPLEEAAQGHQISEAGHARGKIVLRVV
jgi:NADPH:quinone reductase-like Zn-dependent oxidoreductase